MSDVRFDLGGGEPSVEAQSSRFHFRLFVIEVTVAIVSERHRLGSWPCVGESVDCFVAGVECAEAASRAAVHAGCPSAAGLFGHPAVAAFKSGESAVCAASLTPCVAPDGLADHRAATVWGCGVGAFGTLDSPRSRTGSCSLVAVVEDEGGDVVFGESDCSADPHTAK